MSKLLPYRNPVDANLLDNFIKHNNIPIREEHRQLLINYGSSKDILNNGFSNLTFEKFQKHYLDNSLPFEDQLPINTVYVGIDFADEYICIDNDTGKIHLYYNRKKEKIYYDDLNSLVFICFIRSLYIDIFFEKIINNAKINNPTKFFEKNAKYKIGEIQESILYTIGNKLYIVSKHIYKMDCEFIIADIYEGGVMDNYVKICSN